VKYIEDEVDDLNHSMWDSWSRGHAAAADMGRADAESAAWWSAARKKGTTKVFDKRRSRQSHQS
jgi:hypothetical protein